MFIGTYDIRENANAARKEMKVFVSNVFLLSVSFFLLTTRSW